MSQLKGVESLSPRFRQSNPVQRRQEEGIVISASVVGHQWEIPAELQESLQRGHPGRRPLQCLFGDAGQLDCKGGQWPTGGGSDQAGHFLRHPAVFHQQGADLNDLLALGARMISVCFQVEDHKPHKGSLWKPMGQVANPGIPPPRRSGLGGSSGKLSRIVLLLAHQRLGVPDQRS